MGTPNCWKLLMGGIRNSKEQNPETNHTNQALKATNKIIVSRGVARGGPGVPVTLLPPPPLGRPSFEQTTYNIQVAKTP